MKVDLLFQVRDLKGKHPMALMREMGIKCDAMASIPMSEVWTVWGVDWEGDLPMGVISREALPSDQRLQDPSFKEGFFCDGVNGTFFPLKEAFAREEEV